MVTVYVRVNGEANRGEVKRILGPGRFSEKNGAFQANIAERSDAGMMVIQLNTLHNVQARILEATDGRQPG